MRLYNRFVISYIMLFSPIIANGQIIKFTNLVQVKEDYNALLSDYSPQDILIIFEVKNAIFKPLFTSEKSFNSKELNQVKTIRVNPYETK
ncbi:hypothetical protein [Candidatus Tisiphia endosymbiont of Nemotelus uliginosus]|uniref:hypothetical protein n=1 Tax=Candidatus Tisiphia endosymbiont of Nemotelus uliginosus TaxID=3077926 RepID=UPI0035C9067E